MSSLGEISFEEGNPETMTTEQVFLCLFPSLREFSVRKNWLLLNVFVACFTNDDYTSVPHRSHGFSESLPWFAPVQIIFLNTDLCIIFENFLLNNC